MKFARIKSYTIPKLKPLSFFYKKSYHLINSRKARKLVLKLSRFQREKNIHQRHRNGRLEFEPSPETLYESLPSTSNKPQGVLYETPKRSSAASEIQSDDDDGADESPEIQEHVRKFGREHFGKIASPYLTPYLYNNRFLDKQYDIRKEADGTFMIGDAPLTVDRQSNITIYGKE
jgi:hypothetical protein